MPYRRPQAYARKDLLTPGGYNLLAQGARLLDEGLRVEHTTVGEHNSITIARTVGTVERDGSFYELLGFDGDATLAGATATPFGSAANPVAGKVILTLPPGRFASNLPVIAQNASATGANSPCMTTAGWLTPPGVSDVFVTGQVEVYSTHWNGTLGVAGSGSWQITGYGGGEDASFHLSAHGHELATGAQRDFGQPLVARQGNRSGNGDTYTNQLIQGCADLEAALRAGHSAGGHDLRSIPKAWAHVEWNGSRYVIEDQECADSFDAGVIGSVSVGDTAGRADVIFAAPMFNSGGFAHSFYQVFVDVDYPRLSGASEDVFIACAPLSHQSPWGFSLFFYKRLLSGGGEEYFERNGACDFHVWIYHDHGTV